MENLDKIATELRRELIKLHYDKKVGHTGIALSSLDIIIALYFGVMTKKDKFVLSKSHAATAFYIVLHNKKMLNDEIYKSFHHNNSELGEHVTLKNEFMGGSLGHGEAYAVGLAYGAKLNKEKGRIYCLTGDAEWQEGSSLETLQLVSRLKLDNLCFIVDMNLFGAYQKISTYAMENLKNYATSLGFKTSVVDGHDIPKLIKKLKSNNKKSQFILCKTVMGHGIPTMEKNQSGHYRPPNDKEWEEVNK